MKTTQNLEHIVVVEDEPTLREDLVEYLEVSGYSAVGAGSVAEYRRLSALRRPDLVLLDINLPDGDGFALARELRGSAACGVVMLTSRGTLEDRLTGLDCGADAYLVKHADLREIEATIRSVLRRLAGQQPSEPLWHYDPLSWQLQAPNGRAVKLTASEAVFVALLLETPGQVVARERIAAALPRPKESSDRGLDTLLKRLRKKVEAGTGSDVPVNVVYGVGYCFAARVSAAPALR